MKKLEEALTEIRAKYPQIADLGAWEGRKLLVETNPFDQCALDILSRAHSASRCGEYHDTESVVEQKKAFREKYNISPEWEGPGMV